MSGAIPESSPGARWRIWNEVSPSSVCFPRANDMANVTFIGLGRMGLGMAQRLLAAGHRLRVYNRTASQATSLVEQGATFCPSPKEAAQGAELIFSMVS